MRLTVDRLDHIVLHCRDVEVMASWYQRVLGMEREEFGAERRTALRFGGQKINLRSTTEAAEQWATGGAPSPGSADLCFVVAVTAEHVVEHLRDCGVTIKEGPAVKVGALGPMNSVYCRDPEDNLIEIASYLDRI